MFNTLTVFAEPAAQTADAAAQAAGPTELLASFLPLILMFVVFWFILIRPQKKKEKELKNMLLKIIVDSKDGGKVNIKLPMLIVKTFLDSGMPISINGNKSLENIDFKQIFDLVEQGVVGELVNIESNDGDVVRIVVE